MSAQNALQREDRIEKLITFLGQRMNALTRTLQMIAESLQGVESHTNNKRCDPPLAEDEVRRWPPEIVDINLLGRRLFNDRYLV